MNLIRNINEVSVSVMLIERERFGRETARTAHNRSSFPLALAGLARVRRVGKVEVHIMDDNQIQKSVSIEIEERAACTPAWFWRKQPALLGLVLECAIAKISIENVLSPLCNEQVRITMIIYVSDTDPLPPSGGLDSRLVSNVFEFQSAQIVIKEMLRLRSPLSSVPELTRKMSGRPSLSKSKIATPLPVVSTMYCFEVSEPEMSTPLSPAWAAMS